MFIYVIDKSVGSIKSIILIMIINRYSKSLQNVNICAWLNFSKKKYKKRERGISQPNNSGINFCISESMNFLIKLRRRNETGNVKHAELRRNTYMDYDLQTFHFLTNRNFQASSVLQCCYSYLLLQQSGEISPMFCNQMFHKILHASFCRIFNRKYFPLVISS